MSSLDEAAPTISFDPTLNERLLKEHALPERDYLILFTARSGSSWLTELLSGHLGYPEEFINPAFIGGVCRFVGATTPRPFLDALRATRKANGVFGIEATSVHIELFGEDDFFGAFGELTVFHLWRENLVAQAVSLFRAVETGRFHSVEGPNPPDPDYDADKLAHWLQHLAECENSNVRMLVDRRLSATHIKYEDIVKSRERTLELFCRHLGVDASKLDADAAPPAHTKLGNEWGLEVERRFREERAELVERVSSARRVLDSQHASGSPEV